MNTGNILIHVQRLLYITLFMNRTTFMRLKILLFFYNYQFFFVKTNTDNQKDLKLLQRNYKFNPVFIQRLKIICTIYLVQLKG